MWLRLLFLVLLVCNVYADDSANLVSFYMKRDVLPILGKQQLDEQFVRSVLDSHLTGKSLRDYLTRRLSGMRGEFPLNSVPADASIVVAGIFPDHLADFANAQRLSMKDWRWGREAADDVWAPSWYLFADSERGSSSYVLAVRLAERLQLD